MKNEKTTVKSAPMSAAPILYDKEGKIDWGKMWTSYCTLARDGGPSHRGKEQSIVKKDLIDVNNVNFRKVMAEAKRGARQVVHYPVAEYTGGWLTLKLKSTNMAKWFAGVINEENVEAKALGIYLCLPINDDFDIEHDVKSIITVIGKATHYWENHRTLFSKIMIHIFGFDPQWIQG